MSFFRRHAYSIKHHKVVGRPSATALAEAEAEATARGWRVEWEGDPDGSVEALGAVLRDESGRMLASLWGIVRSSRNYRRVIEARLALEALSRED